MKLLDIRNLAPGVWKEKLRLILYPEILANLHNDPNSLMPNDILDDQYAYIVNVFLIHDYIEMVNDVSIKLSPPLSKISVFRLWGDFMNMQGLNQFFNYDLDERTHSQVALTHMHDSPEISSGVDSSEKLKPTAIKKSNCFIDAIIQIVDEVFCKFMPFCDVKLFREGGDEIGGLLIFHGELTKDAKSNLRKTLKNAVKTANRRADELVNKYKLNVIEYAKDPDNISRMGCGFVMDAIYTTDPLNSMTQIILEHRVKQEKERIGKKRREAFLPQKINFLSAISKEEIYLNLEQTNNIKQPHYIPSLEGKLLSPQAYCNGVIKSEYILPFLLSQDHISTNSILFVLRLSNLRGINEEYGHLVADYYFLKLLDAIGNAILNEKNPDIAKNTFHMCQLRLLDMRVNNTVGIMLDDLPRKYEQELRNIIIETAQQFCESISLLNLPDPAKKDAFGLPVFITQVRMSEVNIREINELNHVLSYVYDELDIIKQRYHNTKSVVGCSLNSDIPLTVDFSKTTLFPLLDEKNSSFFQIKEPLWFHKDIVNFKTTFAEYLKTTFPYLLGSTISAVANYFSNLVFLESVDSEKASLTAVNIMYAEQASLVNPTLAISSGIGILIGEEQKNAEMVSKLYKNGLMMCILAGIPCGALLLSSRLILLPLREPEAAINLLEKYFISYVWSMPAQMGIRAQQQALLALNKTNIVSVQQWSQAILNTILNYGLVKGIFSFPPMGIQSLGYAMSLASWFNFLGMFLYMASKKEFENYQFSTFVPPEIKIIKDLSKLGLPFAGQMFIEQIGKLGTALMAGWLGDNSSAAAQIIERYTFPAIILGFACSQSLGILIGQANGEENYIKVKNNFISAMLFTLAILLPLIVTLIFFPMLLTAPLIDINDSKNTMVLSLLPTLMKIHSVNLILNTIRNVVEGGLRGTGNTMFAFVCNFFCTLFSLSVGYYLAFIRDMGINGLAIASTIGITIIDLLLLKKLTDRISHAISYGEYPPSSSMESLRDEELEKRIVSRIPKNFTLGKITNIEDSFFDSIAEAKNHQDKSHHYSAKELRELCDMYAKKHDWVRSAVEATGENYNDYLTYLSFTSEELKALSLNSNSSIPTPSIDVEKAIPQTIKGKVNIEGRILCEILKINLRILDLTLECNMLQLYVDEDGNLQTTLHLTEIHADETDKTLNVAVSDNHFVPLFIKVSNRFSLFNMIGNVHEINSTDASLVVESASNSRDKIVGVSSTTFLDNINADNEGLSLLNNTSGKKSYNTYSSMSLASR